MPGLGTLINVAAVGVGSLVGIFAGHRLPDRIRVTIMQGLALVVLAIGIVGLEPLLDADLGLRRAIILIGAVTIGGALGEALRLEEKLESVGVGLQRRFGVTDTDVAGHDAKATFVQGFVLASAVFCVGPLAVLGSVEDGLGISIRTLAIKSALDMFASVGFASIYGWGVAASMLTIALYQGALTAGAALISPLLTPEVLAQLSVVGSILVMGIALKILEVKDVRIVAMSPAVLIGPVAAGIVEALA
jgi:uncharacterized membrane protein YqgA involved in biofilm formation